MPPPPKKEAEKEEGRKNSLTIPPALEEGFAWFLSRKRNAGIKRRGKEILLGNRDVGREQTSRQLNENPISI